MKSVKDKVYHKIYDQVSNRVWNYDQLWSQIRDRVWRPVRFQVKDMIMEQIK